MNQQKLGQFGFPCPACRRLITATSDLAGQDLKCLACQAIVNVPRNVPTPRMGKQAEGGSPKLPALPDGPRFKLVPRLIPREKIDPTQLTESDWGHGKDPVPKLETVSRKLRIPEALLRRLLLVAAVLLIAAAVLAVQRFEQLSEAPRTQMLLDAEDDQTLSPYEIVEKFLDPETGVDDRLAMFREPFNQEAAREHFEAHADELEVGIAFQRLVRHTQMLDVGYHGFHVGFRSGAQRYICVVDDPEGYRIDWEAYVRASGIAWNALLSGEMAEQEMPVLIQRSVYYDHEFSDKEGYSAFVLQSPENEMDLFGYARRHSLTEQIILQTITEVRLEGGPNDVPMKLRLESADGSHKHRQFLISHVVASTWVESSMGTLEELWAVSRGDEPLFHERMRDAAERFNGALMYEQGISIVEEAPELAAGLFRNVLEIDPGSFEARIGLGSALSEAGQWREADLELTKVVKEDPALADAHYQLGANAVRQGNLDEALDHFEATLRRNPFHMLALNNVAWLLATHEQENFRVEPRVVEIAERAVALSDGTSPSFLSTLGVAYAAVGRFEDAVTATRKAIVLLEDVGTNPSLKEKLRRRILVFEKREPFESAPRLNSHRENE